MKRSRIVLLTKYDKNAKPKYSEKIGKIKGGKFYPWISYNKFGKTEENPQKQGWKTHEVSNDAVEYFIEGNNESKINEINQFINYKKYFTHFNGGFTYAVYIKDKNVYVYSRNIGWLDKFDINSNIIDDMYYFPNKVGEFKNVSKIFIGKSPKTPATEFSGGYGSGFDGNSILLELGKENNKYCYQFIGENMTTFITDNRIVKYVSLVGNSDVPYPYAVDDKNNYFLITSRAYIHLDGKVKPDDPYNIYYKMHDITPGFENIKEFYIGDEKYNLTWDADPGSDYDGIKERFDNKPLYIVKNNGKKEKLNKKEYVDLLNRYGEKMGLKKMDIITPFNI